jgi:hypothetical protein
LGLRRRRGHAPDRRVDKECGAFVHGVPVAGKAKTAELIEKAVVESAGALEPIDVGGKEVKIFEEIPAPAAATINPVCRRGYWRDLGKAVGPRMTNGFVLLWPKVDSLGNSEVLVRNREPVGEPPALYGNEAKIARAMATKSSASKAASASRTLPPEKKLPKKQLRLSKKSNLEETLLTIAEIWRDIHARRR